MYDTLDNPRNYDNLGTLVLFHRRYSLSNETDYRSELFANWDELESQLYKDGAAVVLPVFAYDHSGLFISTQVENYWWHYAWDGGQLGFIFVTKAKAREEYGWKHITPARRQQLTEHLVAEVNEYARYLIGEPETED